jgi:hypothetical protein
MMTATSLRFAAFAAVAALSIAGCKSSQAPVNSAGDTTAGAPAGTPDGSTGTSADGSTTGTTGSTGGTSSGIPTLVNVDLHNILNDVSVAINVNRDNIPVTAQVPIDVAANVCGVSVDVLAASVASGHATCTATTTTPQLTQAVQQQIASGGSVTGGDQTMGGTATH